MGKEWGKNLEDNSFCFFLCVCYGLSWTLTHGACRGFSVTHAFLRMGLWNPSDKTPHPRKLDSGICHIVCLTNGPQALLFIHHLPPSYPFFPQVTAHVTHLQCSAKCQLLCSPLPSFKWVAYGWPQSALRTWKTKPVTACLFFYLANSTPHLLSHTKLLPSNKRHTYTPLLPHLPCHTHSWTTFLHPYPPYSPTPHTHKHTWPTSFPVRHESDGWSAFTGVIHGY